MANSKKPDISIIVPVYNVEKYLKKCLDSIINQAFQNFELILVDDGSTDSSGKICDEYKLKDERIRVIHQENGGLSAARNAGIDAATAEYIGFVDGDDYISYNMYEFLHNCLIENNADVAVCGMYNCFKNKKVPQYKKKEFYLLDNVTALKMTLEGVAISMYAVNKLYKRELFNEIRFPEGKIYEDVFTIPKILFESKKIVVKTLPLYYYVHHSGTITTSSYKKKDLDIINAGFQILKFVEKNCPKLKKQAEFRFFWSFMHVLDKMLLTENLQKEDLKKYTEIIKLLKKNFMKIMLNPYFTKARKIGMSVLYLNENLYKKLVIKKQKTNKLES